MQDLVDYKTGEYLPGLSASGAITETGLAITETRKGLHLTGFSLTFLRMEHQRVHSRTTESGCQVFAKSVEY